MNIRCLDDLSPHWYVALDARRHLRWHAAHDLVARRGIGPHGPTQHEAVQETVQESVHEVPEDPVAEEYEVEERDVEKEKELSDENHHLNIKGTIMSESGGGE